MFTKPVVKAGKRLSTTGDTEPATRFDAVEGGVLISSGVTVVCDGVRVGRFCHSRIFCRMDPGIPCCCLQRGLV